MHWAGLEAGQRRWCNRVCLRQSVTKMQTERSHTEERSESGTLRARSQNVEQTVHQTVANVMLKISHGRSRALHAEHTLGFPSRNEIISFPFTASSDQLTHAHHPHPERRRHSRWVHIEMRPDVPSRRFTNPTGWLTALLCCLEELPLINKDANYLVSIIPAHFQIVCQEISLDRVWVGQIVCSCHKDWMMLHFSGHLFTSQMSIPCCLECASGYSNKYWVMITTVGCVAQLEAGLKNKIKHIMP